MSAQNSPEPVAITVAPNGGRRTKADHPGMPLTAAELARSAAECREAGAAMIHVHVRRQDGAHLLDADAYRDVLTAIGREVGNGMLVQITSEALGVYTPDQQMAVVKAVRPEAVSLALRELLPDDGHEETFATFLLWLKREHILPQIIVYEPAEARRLGDLCRRGIVPWPSVPVLYVLGRYTVNQTAEPSDLLPFLGPDQPRFGHWSVCAFGAQEAACVTAAALLGGHVRVGFENNLLMPDGRIATGNADLVGAALTPLRALGRSSQTASGLKRALQTA
jgi:uncharacterized protein (DUF849 family)